MTEVLGSTQQRAKKQHRCDHCRTTIEPGEEYHRHFIKDGGDTWTWKSHLDCRDLAIRMFDDQNMCWDEGIDLSEEWSNERENMLSYRDEFPAVIARFEALGSKEGRDG